MLIRRATSHDLPAVTAIYNQGVRSRLSTCDEEERTLEERTRWFSQFSDQHPLFVGEMEGKVVAYGAIFPISPKSGFRFSVEHSIYLDESVHGKGLGKQMLIHLISETRRLGYRYLEARIFKHNTISIRLHEALGFKLVGIQERVANLDGKWFDNCIYALHL